MRRIITFAVALGACGVVTATAAEPELDYAQKVQDIVAKFNAKLNEAQPYLVWPGDDLDQTSRDKKVWKLEVIINDLTAIKAELDALPVPAGFEDAQKLISGAFELYMTALSRCGSGIQRNYVKTFNGGVSDYNAAGQYLMSGMDELADALRRAGYHVE